MAALERRYQPRLGPGRQPPSAPHRHQLIRSTIIATQQDERSAFKPFDVVLYDHEEATGLYFQPGTLATKPAGNWSHICIGRPRLRTLTDQELAAMYWHARHSHFLGQGCHRDSEGNLVDEALVLERFARLPSIHDGWEDWRPAPHT